MKNVLRYMLYLVLSFGFGYASFMCGPDNDYLGKLSLTLLPLLTTILVLYTTLSNLVLGQMQKYQETGEIDVAIYLWQGVHKRARRYFVEGL